MPLSINQQVRLIALAVSMASAPAIGAERRPLTTIAEPPDQRPGAITRPANAADRAWRKGRRSPSLEWTRQTPPPPRFQAPRYTDRGRRNVPGRPDTLDQYGRAGFDRPRPEIAPIGPTVRTDAPSRINQVGR